MKKKIYNYITMQFYFFNLRLALYRSRIFCPSLILFLSVFHNGISQPWQQLGPGAGGQERAVYLYYNPSTGKYDLYVGSDVSGVWKAKDIDPASWNVATNYNFKYISNNRIFRFINTFYNPADYPSNFLYVGSRGGIDRIDLTNINAVTESLIFPAGYNLSQSWVSSIYMGTDVSLGERPIYFITGTTRVNDEPDNFKDWNDATNPVFDFYYGTINVSDEKTVSITNQFNFSDWNASTTRNVFCMYVDEHGTGFTDDEFYIGTELGLYHFTNPANLSSATRLNGPNGATDYKVTSITKVGTGGEFLITISDDDKTIGGLWKYSVAGGWVNNILQLMAQRKINGGCTIAMRDISGEDNARYFTKVLPLKAGSSIFGWLLFNEKNLLDFPLNPPPCNQGPYFAGVFYAPKNTADDFPGVNWTVLETFAGTNHWGWNASKPCSNINGALLTPDNHLIIGKQGNIFITQNAINSTTPTNTNWQQIYTREIPNYCNTDNAYFNGGYVNTATQTIYPEGNGKVWYSDRDRQISYSDDNGGTSLQVTVNSSCKTIVPNAAQDPCNEYTINPDYKFSDCLFITENKANPTGDLNLYAGIAEGYSQNKGRGVILEYNPTGTDWTQLGDAVCGDPVKMLFTKTGEKYLIAKDAQNKLHKFDGTAWNQITVINSGENILDAVASPDGDTLFVIKGNGTDRGVYMLTWSGSVWSTECIKLDNTANVEPKRLILLPYSNGPGEHLYKVLCGTSPKSVNSSSSNLYEIFDNKQPSVCTENAITGTSPSATNDIFKYLNMDEIDFTDEGVTAIEVNEETRTLYVAVVRTDASNTYGVESHLYRNTYDNTTGIISTNAWNDISGSFSANRLLPNKSLIFLNAHGSQTCNEYLYACVRGLGPWKFEIPAFNIGTPVTVNITCNGANNGSITMNPVGGEQPYSYSLDGTNFQASNVFSNLAPATYTITVSDNRGCTATVSTTITQPTVLTASASATTVLCFGGNNGSVTLTVSGGTTNYSYLWSNGGVSQNLNNVIAGVYTVTVTDANGCTVSTTATVTQPNVLSATLTPTMPLCFGGNNGKIDVTATGGTPAYGYLWNTGASGTTITGLTTGIYTVTVTDANGCTFSSSITLIQPSQLSASASQTAMGCTGSSIGEAEATVNGGTSGYAYSWSPLGGTNATATGLPPGIYTISITDANSCTATSTVTIIEDENCCGVFGNTFTYSPGSNPPPGSYDLNTSFSVASGTTLTLTTCTLAIAKNVTITLEPNSILEILVTSFLYSCGDMWGGIINTGGTVIINDSEIDDAETALYSDNNGGASVFNLNLARLDANYISISLNNDNFTTSTFENSTFTCHGVLKAPHAGEKTRQHFNILNAQANIGNSGSTPVNVLEDASDGIYADNYSTVTVNNCVFNNLANNGSSGAAISANTGTNLSVGLSAANNFTDCSIAVYSDRSYNTDIRNNTFEQCQAGLFAASNGSNNIFIKDNIFRECNSFGVYIADLNKLTPGCVVSNNYFYGEKDAAGTPISYDAIDVFNWTNYIVPVHIDNNHIYDYISGIYVTNLKGSAALNTINNNIINYTFTDAEIGSNYYYGITATGCDRLRVYRNTIEWTGVPSNFDPQPYNWQMTGYYFQECINSSIFKNNALRCGKGMEMRGQCPNTFLICNHYENVYPGISMFQLYLDPQGSICSSNQNNWTGSYTGGATDYNKIRGSVVNPINWYYDSPSTNPSPFDPFFIINPIQTTCLPGDPACGLADSDVEDYDAQERMINGVIGDSLPYGDDANANRYKAQAYIYDAMKENDTLINTTEREQYMSETEQSNIGLFAAVIDSVATDNLYEAEAINTTIVDTNLIESNSKAVNEIIVRLAQSDTMQLIASDSVTLDYISLQDPITGGKAVFEARALLHRKIYDANYGNNLRTANESSTISINEIVLFPNPAKNFILLKLNSKTTYMVKFTITDVTGRKLFEKAIGYKTNLYKIDLTGYLPGSYCIKINTSDRYQFTKQFVLVR